MSQCKLITWGNYSIEQPWNDFDVLLESSLADITSLFHLVCLWGQMCSFFNVGAVLSFPDSWEGRWRLSVCLLNALGLVRNQVSLRRNDHHEVPRFEYRNLWIWREKKMKDLLEILSYLLVMCPLEIKLLSQNLDSRPVLWFAWGIWTELWAKSG